MGTLTIGRIVLSGIEPPPPQERTMSITSIDNPYAFFTDTNGKALENGNIYVGVAGLDAKTNQIPVYWDSTATIPAAQPIRTVEGYPDNAGTPSDFFSVVDYSITVEDAAGVLIYSKVLVAAEVAALIYTDLAALLATDELSRGVGALWMTGDFSYIEANVEAADYDEITVSNIKLYKNSDPLAVLIIGASNAAGHENAIGGNREILNGIHAWDSNSHDVSDVYIAGSQYVKPKFGSNPLDYGNGQANNLGLQTSLALAKATGRPVYFVILAMSGYHPESFIDPTLRNDNGWTIQPGDRDLTGEYPNIALALAAIPGNKPAFDAILWYGTAGATDGKSIWQPKFSAVLDTLETEGLANRNTSQMVAFTTAPGRASREVHQQAITDEAVRRPNLTIVNTQGAPLADTAHYFGDGLTRIGRQAAIGLLAGDKAPNNMIYMVDETDGDTEAFSQIFHQTGDALVILKNGSDGYVEQTMNSNLGVFKIRRNDLTDSQWVTATAYTSGDERRYVVPGDVEGNIYQATSTGTSGGTPPGHTSGTVSDGGVDWLFLRSTLGETFDTSPDGISIRGGAKRIQIYDRELLVTPDQLEISDAASGGNLATFATRSARYTILGRDCWIYGNFIAIDTTGMTGANELFITGLPFVAADQLLNFPGLIIPEVISNSGASYTDIKAQVILNTAYFQLIETGSGQVSQPLTVASLSSGVSGFEFSIHYRITDPLA